MWRRRNFETGLAPDQKQRPSDSTGRGSGRAPRTTDTVAQWVKVPAPHSRGARAGARSCPKSQMEPSRLRISCMGPWTRSAKLVSPCLERKLMHREVKPLVQKLLSKGSFQSGLKVTVQSWGSATSLKENSRWDPWEGEETETPPTSWCLKGRFFLAGGN